MSGPYADLPDGTQLWALIDDEGSIDSIYLDWEEARADLLRRGINPFGDPPVGSELEAEDADGEVTDPMPSERQDFDDARMAANARRLKSAPAELATTHLTPMRDVLRVMGLPQLTRSSIEMPLAEAFARLRDYLPPAWSTPNKAITQLLRTNSKSEKTDREHNIRSRTLSLMPHRLFAQYVERGLHPKSDEDRDYKRLFYRPGDERVPSKSVCPNSVDGCRRGCLVVTGQNFLSLKEEMLSAVRAKAAATRCLYLDPEAFGALLHHSIARNTKLAARYKRAPAVRLNNYSDIPWEEFFPDLFEEHRDVQFFDYTKVPGRSNLPDNYFLCFSYSGTPQNIKECERSIRMGRSVAVVFLHDKGWRKRLSDDVGSREYRFPETMNIGSLTGVPVIDGLKHDARWLDQEIPAVVGLVYKTANEILYDQEAGTSRLAKIDPASMGKFVVRCTVVGGYLAVVQTPAATRSSAPVIGADRDEDEDGNLVKLRTRARR